MVQTLDVISVNLWQILISLANLLILFKIIKKFLYKPVKNVIAQRDAEIEERYIAASKAQEAADENREKWETRLSGAESEADTIIASATENAKIRSEKIVEEANVKAHSIIRKAETEAQLEMQKAEESIRREIVEVSTALAGKLLEREINVDDHRGLIDSFIEKIGDEE